MHATKKETPTATETCQGRRVNGIIVPQWDQIELQVLEADRLHDLWISTGRIEDRIPYERLMGAILEQLKASL
jgi:hypothetical protein